MQVLSVEKTRKIIPWRGAVSTPVMLLFAGAATCFRLGIEVCAVCVNALDAWRRDG